MTKRKKKTAKPVAHKKKTTGTKPATKKKKTTTTNKTAKKKKVVKGKRVARKKATRKKSTREKVAYKKATKKKAQKYPTGYKRSRNSNVLLPEEIVEEQQKQAKEVAKAITSMVKKMTGTLKQLPRLLEDEGIEVHENRYKVSFDASGKIHGLWH